MVHHINEDVHNINLARIAILGIGSEPNQKKIVPTCSACIKMNSNFSGKKESLVSDSCESKNAYPYHPSQMSGSPAESPLRHHWFGTSIALLLAACFRVHYSLTERTADRVC